MLRVKEQWVKGGVIEGVSQFKIVALVDLPPVPWKGNPRRAGGFPFIPSEFEGVSGNPLLGLTRDSEKRLKVIETKRGSIAPFPRLILEWAGEGRREERTFLAAIRPNRRFDVAASQRVRGFVVSSHRVSSFVEMTLALSQEEESQRTVHEEA
jgi:hypothetical protein